MLYSLRISSVSEIARPIRFGRNITSQVMSSIARISLRELYTSLKRERRSYACKVRKIPWPECGKGNNSGLALERRETVHSTTVTAESALDLVAFEPATR